MNILLTGLQIQHLAESAGFTIDPKSIDDDVLDSVHSIEDGPTKGLFDEDTGITEHYQYISRCDGCDPGECMPLGLPLG